jgi:putative nucleotidyltransferase with HDIG domain
LDNHARSRLLADICLEESGEQSLLDEDVRRVLLTFRGRRKVIDPSIAKVVAALEISDDFDQFFEAGPLFEPEEADQCASSSVQTMMSYLQVTSRADVSRVIDRLPIFPRAAKQVVKKVADPEVTLDELESVASLDPVLTGRLIQTANSAYYSPARPIGSIQHAIAYIGVDVTRKVLLAATIRGNFASMRLHQLWNHSLDVAHAAEELSRHATAKIDPSEAFLAGLVHDIGRLAFSIMPARYLERFNRLTDGGCPPVQVEQCLSGRSHAEVGSETLTQWKFPEWAVEAIRCHHSPERSSSPLASLIYLAEFVADSDEDLPSFARLTSACRQAGIDADAIAQIDGKDRDILDGLRFVA